MNKISINQTVRYRHAVKAVNIMRICILLLIIGATQAIGRNTYSQTALISFHMNNATIEDVINDIEAQSEFRFLYNKNIVDVDSKVSILANNESITSVLDNLFRNVDISYAISDRQIVLNRRGAFINILPAIAQQSDRRIIGTVTDMSGETIIGVNVLEKGTTNGTVTDADGNFTLTVPDNAVLQVSYVGYITQEIHVLSALRGGMGGNYLIIKIEENTQMLEEIAVIGYGSRRKSDLTGAISSIKTENLEMPSRNVHDVLRANIAGLNIGIATDAKAEASMSIRGKGTLAAGSDPLIVLDGVIYEGALADINPEDIASVDILKDASSTAVYGAKAANGVIAFTTKQGKQGKPVINVNATVGIAQVASQPGILDANGFLRFRQDYNEGRNSDAYLAEHPQMFVNPFELNGVSQLDWYNYDQATPVTSVTEQQMTTQWLSRLNLTIPEIENYLTGKITKWDDLVFQDAFQQSYSASVANSTEHTSQYISLNWTDREGIITGDRYKVFQARVNVESKVTSFLTVGINAQFASRDERYLKSAWEQMTMISPYGSNNINDPESKYQRRPTGLDPVNPFYDNLYTDRKDQKNNINAKLYAQIILPFDIEYTMNYTPYYHYSEFYNHYSSKGDNWKAIGGSSERTLAKRFNWQIDNIINWKKEFDRSHKAEVTLLMNAEKARYWQTSAKATSYSPNDALGYHRLQAGTVPSVSSNDTYQTGDALMARLFYSFRNKYMFTASVRRDGFSAFGKMNPHAIFPAIAFGWVLTQEDFTKKLQEDGLGYAKLRFSWGENGNRDIGQYAALSQMVSALHPYINQSGTTYSTSQIYVSTMSNYNLKWERTASYNMGLDFSLFHDILSGSIETYLARTNDLLVNRALPNITGYSSVTSNLGQLQNKGLEISLNASILKNKNFQWSAFAVFSMNRRKINKLYGDMVDIADDMGNIIGQKEANDETNGWFIGQDPDRIWAYARNSVWQLNEKDEAAKYGCQPGDFKYVDQNKDEIMDNKDKIFQGYTTPRYQWSLRNDLKYKDFSLSATAYSFGNYYAAFQRAANNYAFPDRTSDYDFPRWTSTNPINDYARIGSKNIGTNWVNKSFVRLENVSLSYRLPKRLLSHFQVQGLRLTLSAQNPCVYAPNWQFWDPESGSVTPRTYSLTVNITL
jgi:TonB-linked SusC/RagA family outer membrane protein